jgi:hypothetical protein
MSRNVKKLDACGISIKNYVRFARTLFRDSALRPWSAQRGERLFDSNTMMQIETKMFQSHGDCTQIVMLARGVLNIAGLHQIFAELHRITEHCAKRAALIDLVDSTYELGADELDVFVDETSWRGPHKIALISARAKEHFNRLSILSASLSSRGLQTAVFYDEKVALEWLAHGDGFLM